MVKLLDNSNNKQLRVTVVGSMYCSFPNFRYDFGPLYDLLCYLRYKLKIIILCQHCCHFECLYP